MAVIFKTKSKIPILNKTYDVEVLITGVDTTGTSTDGYLTDVKITNMDGGYNFYSSIIASCASVSLCVPTNSFVYKLSGKTSSNVSVIISLNGEKSYYCWEGFLLLEDTDYSFAKKNEIVTLKFISPLLKLKENIVEKKKDGYYLNETEKIEKPDDSPVTYICDKFSDYLRKEPSVFSKYNFHWNMFLKKIGDKISLWDVLKNCLDYSGFQILESQIGRSSFTWKFRKIYTTKELDSDDYRIVDSSTEINNFIPYSKITLSGELGDKYSVDNDKFIDFESEAEPVYIPDVFFKEVSTGGFDEKNVDDNYSTKTHSTVEATVYESDKTEVKESTVTKVIADKYKTGGSPLVLSTSQKVGELKYFRYKDRDYGYSAIFNTTGDDTVDYPTPEYIPKYFEIAPTNYWKAVSDLKVKYTKKDDVKNYLPLRTLDEIKNGVPSRGVLSTVCEVEYTDQAGEKTTGTLFSNMSCTKLVNHIGSRNRIYADEFTDSLLEKYPSLDNSNNEGELLLTVPVANDIAYDSSFKHLVKLDLSAIYKSRFGDYVPGSRITKDTLITGSGISATDVTVNEATSKRYSNNDLKVDLSKPNVKLNALIWPTVDVNITLTVKTSTNKTYILGGFLRIPMGSSDGSTCFCDTKISCNSNYKAAVNSFGDLSKNWRSIAINHTDIKKYADRVDYISVWNFPKSCKCGASAWSLLEVKDGGVMEYISFGELGVSSSFKNILLGDFFENVNVKAEDGEFYVKIPDFNSIPKIDGKVTEISNIMVSYKPNFPAYRFARYADLGATFESDCGFGSVILFHKEELTTEEGINNKDAEGDVKYEWKNLSTVYNNESNIEQKLLSTDYNVGLRHNNPSDVIYDEKGKALAASEVVNLSYYAQQFGEGRKGVTTTIAGFPSISNDFLGYNYPVANLNSLFLVGYELDALAGVYTAKFDEVKTIDTSKFDELVTKK